MKSVRSYEELVERAVEERLEGEAAYELARFASLDPGPAMAAAACMRDRLFGPRVSYSRKVFIPLTKLCRDNCGYCTFASTPVPGERAYLTPEEALEIARTGAEAGCKEALFTLGDKPEKRYPEARRELREMGHWASPDKVPARRLETLDAAGRLRVPFTTGLLIGIGETLEERVDTLLAIREQHERHGHLQECIVQNFRAKPGTRMALAPEPSEETLLATIALARLLLPSDIAVQAPPNLAKPTQKGTPSYARYIEAGINDWGGVSPVTPDHVNPEAPWPHLGELDWSTEAKGYLLLERLALHPPYALDAEEWVDEKLRSKVWAAMDAEGFARVESWAPGTTESLPEGTVREARGGRPSKMRPGFVSALSGAGERDLT